jgi:hypothetical protein
MHTFWLGFMSGMKEGPGMFFAPLIGAIRGIFAETHRSLTRRK